MDEELSLKMVENSQEISCINAPGDNSASMTKDPKIISFSTFDADLQPAMADQNGNREARIEEEKKESNPWDLPAGVDLDKLPEEEK